MEFDIVIGLEVHAQLATHSKLFCGCRSVFGDPANTDGCPVCLGLPGALPVLNRTAVDMAILMGLAINCSIIKKSIFARKNYFYPDLPKGYQISQYDLPVCLKGSLPISVDGKDKVIGITRIHLEEDAGKLVHDQDIDTLFDVNRCGTPLIEIVSEPEMTTPQEAYAYLTGLKQILEYLGICDCNMEEGSLRCDANISLKPKGATKLGTKTEIKNMNSFRGVEKALEYEAKRQAEVLLSGGKIEQQTFLWDPNTGTSSPMRSKEDAHDYRYFPEPDLMPLIVSDEMIETQRKLLPELPAVKKSRFQSEHGLSEYAAELLTSSRAIAEYFEQTLQFFKDPRQVSNWIMGDVLRVVNDQKIAIEKFPIEPERLGDLLKLIQDGTVSAKAGKKVFDTMLVENKSPDAIIKEQGLTQVSDSGALEESVKKVVEANPSEVERYKKGETKLMGFFVGQIMKATQGRGNPKEINSILARYLS